MLDDFKKAYDQELARRQIAKEQIKQVFIDNLNQVIAPLLKTEPKYDFYEIYWYAPFFNDGDECEYTLSHIYFDNAVCDRNESDYEPEYYFINRRHNNVKDLIDIETIYDVFNIYTEMVKNIFGDIKITYTHANGFTMEDYTNHE